MFPFCFLQSVLPFFVATKMTRIRKPTLDKPTPERYVAAELTTVGLQSQTNGYFPHAVMVRSGEKYRLCMGKYQVKLNVLNYGESMSNVKSVALQYPSFSFCLNLIVCINL